MEKVRVSRQMLKVFKFLIEKPKEHRSGAEISKATAIGSGTLYPLLQRLELAGLLKSEWEQIDPSEAGRPRRRFYLLTGPGQSEAIAALTEFQIAPGVLVCS